jgi:hypothetical protein
MATFAVTQTMIRIMKNSKFNLILLLLSMSLMIGSCRKEGTKYVSPDFVFVHNVNGSQLQTGTMNYTNLAGNVYEVDELQYFISEIKLKTNTGKTYLIEADSAIHYVDLAIPATLSWSPGDRFPVGDYDSISFVFGINEAKNKTGLFVNPPERDMFWPDMMGGGYHYMKMNGKWMATGDIVKAFNFHIGIGMGEMGMFYQNYFTVTLPLKMHIDDSYHEIRLIMDIEKWFETPNLWDWNAIGGQIMMNQDAMNKARQNGRNVFQVTHTIGVND